MESVMRAKLRVGAVLRRLNEKSEVVAEEVELWATGDADWSMYTPAAKFSLTITNPAFYGTLVQGTTFYVDFTRADVPPIRGPVRR